METTIQTMHGGFPHLLFRFPDGISADRIAEFREDLLDEIFESDLARDGNFEVFELQNGTWTPLKKEDLPWNRVEPDSVPTALPAGSTAPTLILPRTVPTAPPRGLSSKGK